MLSVTRKPHPRKGYTKESGVKVKPVKRVKKTVYKTPDKGAPGRTPKAKQWFTKGVPMGWRKTMGERRRRELALAAHKGDLLATARALQQLANVQTDLDTKQLARLDAQYFLRRYHRGR
jgi:hypothetical protein